MTEPSSLRRRVLALLAATAAVGVGVSRCRREPASDDGVAQALRDGAHNEGYARVEGPRPFTFPRDHAAHPEFRHEWWYVTGHLRDDAQREFGFQLTFFRYALTPVPVDSPSRWRAHDLMLAHFAVSDIGAQRFHHATRRARAALDLAGTDAAQPRIWLRDWSLAWRTDDTWLLHAETAHALLELTLAPGKPLVLQGDRGYSRKSDAAGNASLYYSIPRLACAGDMRLGNVRRPVTGSAWLDREWGTSALGPDQRGWDWFALQFDDGRELTFYRLRRRDGRIDPHSRGLVIERDGSATPLLADDLEMTPQRWWRSPATGLRYPLDWRISSRRARVDVIVEARLDAQEWPGELRYWEGQVAVRDASGACGLGYLEMTGYD